MVGKFCGQFGTEAVCIFHICVEGFLKTVIYCGLLFSLENHGNIKDEVGVGSEKGKRDPQAGEGCPYDPDQGLAE